jgi:hypothetical protein
MINTEYHDDRVKHSSSINGINSTIREAIVLLSLMKVIYRARHGDGLSDMVCTYVIS